MGTAVSANDSAVTGPASGGSSARTLFSIQFQSAMDEDDSARLRAQLGMTTNFQRQHPAVEPPLGCAQLDADSGLFLAREGEDRWALQCRSWGSPSAKAVERWRLSASHVVHQLDASVGRIGREPR